jgi:flavin-dependent dehydrogenase
MGVAIGLARKGVRTIILEQHEHAGDVRRGETIRYDDQMEQILGRGFFDRMTMRKVCRRRYYSHTGHRHVDRTISNPNIIFSWPNMIADMEKVARSEGVVIHYGMRASRILSRDGRIEGIEAGNSESEQMFHEDTVFLCGGSSGPSSLGVPQDRTGIDMSVNKRLVTGYSGPDDRLEYHFHLAPKGLVVGTMFPRGNGEAEFIIMDTTGSGEQAPSFDEFCSEHPLFAALVGGTQAFYELATSIPMGGMLYPFSPMPGLILAGDAIGHVQARGGSGIKTSFLIGHAAGSLAADAMHSGGWTEMKRAAFERAICGHRLVRSLRLHNFFYAGIRLRMFKHFRTPGDMDHAWRFLSLALR